MRLLFDGLIALMLASLLGGVLWHQHYAQQQDDAERQAYRSLARLHEQVIFRSVLEADGAPRSDAGFPRQLDPAWFGTELPRNPLAGDDHPWLDVAEPDDMADHPPDPVLVDRAQAGLWYNPNRGIFRVRVPEQLSERATLRLYNDLNGTAMGELPPQTGPPRQATLHEPGSTPAEAASAAGRHDVGHPSADRAARRAADRELPAPKPRPRLLTAPRDE